MTEEKYLREYIYIDTVEINSLLAQMHEGLETAIKKTNNFSNTATEGHTFSADVNAKGNVGFSKIINGGGSLGGGVKKNSTSAATNGIQDSIETIYSDYSVEVLESELSENNLLSTDTNHVHYGQIIKIESNFDFIDFKSLEAGIDLEFFNYMQNDNSEIEELKKQKNLLNASKKIRNSPEIKQQIKELNSQIKELEKSKKDSSEGFKNLNALARFGSKIFKDTILVKGDKFATYTKSDNFRINRSQINLLMNTPRIGTVIGVVENRFVQEADANFFANLDISNINQIGYGMSNMILSSFNLINDNSLLIKPLAIYFE